MTLEIQPTLTHKSRELSIEVLPLSSGDTQSPPESRHQDSRVTVPGQKISSHRFVSNFTSHPRVTLRSDSLFYSNPSSLIRSQILRPIYLDHVQSFISVQLGYVSNSHRPPPEAKSYESSSSTRAIRKLNKSPQHGAPRSPQKTSN